MVESVENHTEFNTEPDDKGQLNERNAVTSQIYFNVTFTFILGNIFKINK